MTNLNIYNQVRVVPKEAQKPIGGGRLRGMTDISPMWRIKVLTELYGPCGIGWKYEITKKEIVEGSGGVQAAFVDINLFTRNEEGWSEAIPGTGGAMFVAKEASGLFTDDDAYKKALTDAISVSCKALGMGADVYWSKDSTKYSTQEPTEATVEQMNDDTQIIGPTQAKHLLKLAEFKKVELSTIFKSYKIGSFEQMTYEMYEKAIKRLNATKKVADESKV